MLARKDEKKADDKNAKRDLIRSLAKASKKEKKKRKRSKSREDKKKKAKKDKTKTAHWTFTIIRLFVCSNYEEILTFKNIFFN